MSCCYSFKCFIYITNVDNEKRKLRPFNARLEEAQSLYISVTSLLLLDFI